MKNKPLHPSSFILHPYPIDLVYFWVDGSDPKFIAAKNAAMGGAET
ncbi:MAG: Stealth CR1 domain-containing protein, partial [Rickettsiales bacterium]|nr:Stealth CR1 domain-containing protein [Rickettsiales bacterium]